MIGLVLLILAGTGSTVRVDAQADRQTLTLSESVRITLTVEGPAPLRVEAPTEWLSAASLDIWRVRPVAGSTRMDLPNGRQRWTRTLRVDPYETGTHPLQLAAVRVQAGEAAQATTHNWPALGNFVVTSRVADVTTEPRPGTDIEEMPDPRPPDPTVLWLGFGLLAAGTLVTIAFGVWWIRKRRPATSLDVHQWAQAELQKLSATVGDDRDFAGRLSDVVRTYLERRLGLPLTRRTTAEWWELLGTEPSVDPVRPLLERCDAVKFAAQTLTPAERQDLLDQARALVNPIPESM